MWALLLVAWTAAVLLFAACSDEVANPEDVVPQNLVYLDSTIVVDGGDHFSVAVYFENSVPIAGVSVPLKYSSTHMECESLSFVGSRVADWLVNASHFDNAKQEVRIGAVAATQHLEPGNGLLARIHLWVHGNAPDSDIVIDTALLSPNLDLRYADTSVVGNTFVPRFSGCTIQVRSQLP
jgi:hypothetical protein